MRISGFKIFLAVCLCVTAVEIVVVVVLVVAPAAELLRASCSDDNDNYDYASILGFETNKRSRDLQEHLECALSSAVNYLYLQLQEVFLNPFFTRPCC